MFVQLAGGDDSAVQYLWATAVGPRGHPDCYLPGAGRQAGDQAGGYLQIAESDATVGQVINIGSGRGVTIGDLAHKILALTGSKAKIVSDEARIRPEKSEVKQLLCDFTKANKLFGYQPKYSLEDGLMQSIEFVREHPELFRPEEYTI